MPVSRADALRAGGSTACVEVEYDGHRVLFDAGTGIRSYAASGNTHHVFFTHFHWDHVQGLPFFAPLYVSGNTVHLYAPAAAEMLEQTLAAQMQEPYFPVAFGATAAAKMFHAVQEPMVIGPMTIRAVPLHHPGGSHAYVVEAGEKKIVYATDHEHGVTTIDAGLLAAAQGASLLIYDAHYTPAEYPQHKGWGHSTWAEGVRLAERADVGKLLLFHHHPDRSDAAMDAIVAEARAVFPATDVASEGLRLRL